MNTNFWTPVVGYLMKYFFNVEREITQQLLDTLQIKLIDLKDIAIHYSQIITIHK